MKTHSLITRPRLIGLAVVSGLFASNSYAGWIQSLGQSEACISAGGACVAKTGDYGAYYHNPAAANFVDSNSIGGNFRLLDTTHLDLVDSDGNHDIEGTNTEGDIALAPTLGGYHRFSDNLVLGLGFGAPFAITADWTNDDGNHRYNMSDQSLFLIDLTPTLSFQVNEKLSLGVGLNVVTFKQLRLETLIPDSFGAALPPALGGAGVIIPTTPTSPIIGSITLETDSDANLGIPPKDVSVSLDEFAVTVGAQYVINDRLALGLVYRSETDVEWEGNINLSVPALSVNQNTDFSLDLDMPAHVQAGVAYDAIPDALTLSFDIQHTFWSDAKGLGSTAVIEFKDPLLGFINDLQLDYNANDATTYRFGAEYALSDNWSLYGGFAFDESIFDDDSVDILTYDTDRFIYSLGASYSLQDSNGRGWKLHFGGQIIDYDSRKIGVGESANLGGVSLPNLRDADTLGFVPNRGEFEYGGAIYALSFSFQYDN